MSKFVGCNEAVLREISLPLNAYMRKPPMK